MSKHISDLARDAWFIREAEGQGVGGEVALHGLLQLLRTTIVGVLGVLLFPPLGAVEP